MAFLDAEKFQARGGMTKDQVKAAVRSRDGDRCARCGLTNEAHRAKYGRGLQVHRRVPGSLYTVDGCVTLCFPCHGPEPRSDGQTYDAEVGGKFVRLALTEDDHDRLRLAAAQSRLSMAAFAHKAVKRAVDEALPPAKAGGKK